MNYCWCFCGPVFARETPLPLHVSAIQRRLPCAHLAAFIRSVADTSEAEKVVGVEEGGSEKGENNKKKNK